MHEEDNLVENYETPEERVVFVEPEKQTIKDFKELTPWEQLVESAKRYSIDIQPPNKNCKKCSGRGYIGFSLENNNRIPVACKCIFKKEK